LTSVPNLQDECFFIAPIGAEGSPQRRRSDGVLEFIVKRAAEEVGLRAVRADQIAEPGQITLQVIEHVLGARGAVVDLTDLNPNVFYELAVRHTARLPVALIAEKGCSLPFDIAQMRTIFFDHTDLQSADECRRSIVSHLSEALDGAVDSPIATSIDVQSLQSGSVVERNVAELVTTVEDMAKSQRATLELVDRLRMDLRHRDDVSPEAVADLLLGLEHLLELSSEINDERVRDAVREIRAPMDYLERRFGRRRRLTAAAERRRLEMAERAWQEAARLSKSETPSVPNAEAPQSSEADPA
jgi:hypothetical protein